MKAILEGPDKKLHWVDVPAPRAEGDQVMIEIHASALNRADLLQREGHYPPPPGWPEWYGLEAAGTVCALGEQAEKEGKWKIGDPVCALLGGGGYAEYVCVPSGMVMPIPRGLSMEEAAALPEVFGAAYLFLFVEAGLKKGDTVLVTAGASGLASVLIPMAKAFGARVLTTVLDRQQAEAIRNLPADRVIITTEEDLPQALEEELNAGRGVDICVDCLAGETAGRCLPYMNRLGRWVVIASLAGDPVTVDFRSLYARGTRVIGTTLRSRTPEQKAQILDHLVRDIWPMVENGIIRPNIFTVLPIQQAEEAHALMRSGRHAGKIVLKVK